MPPPEPIRVLRLTIRIYADEFPLLTDALLQCAKGRRRATRLSTLAAIGLLSERSGMLEKCREGRALAESSCDPEATRMPMLTAEANRLSDQQLIELMGTDKNGDLDV